MESRTIDFPTLHLHLEQFQCIIYVGVTTLSRITFERMEKNFNGERDFQRSPARAAVTYIYY